MAHPYPRGKKMALVLRGSFLESKGWLINGSPLSQGITQACTIYTHAGTYYGWDRNLKPKFEGNNKDTVAFLSLEEYQKFTFVSRGRDGKLSLDSSGFGKGIMDITP